MSDPMLHDPVVQRILRAADKVAQFEAEKKQLTAELRAGGRTPAEADELAEKALAERKPPRPKGSTRSGGRSSASGSPAKSRRARTPRWNT